MMIQVPKSEDSLMDSGNHFGTMISSHLLRTLQMCYQGHASVTSLILPRLLEIP